MELYHGDAKDTSAPAPWPMPSPSLRRGITATPSSRPWGRTACRARRSLDKFDLNFSVLTDSFTRANVHIDYEHMPFLGKARNFATNGGYTTSPLLSPTIQLCRQPSAASGCRAGGRPLRGSTRVMFIPTGLVLILNLGNCCLRGASAQSSAVPPQMCFYKCCPRYGVHCSLARSASRFVT